MEVSGQDRAVYLCRLLVYYRLALSLGATATDQIRDHRSTEPLGWKAKYILCSIYIRVLKIIVAINQVEIPKPRNGLFWNGNYLLFFFFLLASTAVTDIFPTYEYAQLPDQPVKWCQSPHSACSSRHLHLISNSKWPLLSRSSSLFYFLP